MANCSICAAGPPTGQKGDGQYRRVSGSMLGSKAAGWTGATYIKSMDYHNSTVSVSVGDCHRQCTQCLAARHAGSMLNPGHVKLDT